VKGKSEDDCNNYIRVLAKTETNQLLVCGTNSYNPRYGETPRRRSNFLNSILFDTNMDLDPPWTCTT
jgi:hypothetical protein